MWIKYLKSILNAVYYFKNEDYIVSFDYSQHCPFLHIVFENRVHKGKPELILSLALYDLNEEALKVVSESCVNIIKGISKHKIDCEDVLNYYKNVSDCYVMNEHLLNNPYKE